MSSWSFVLLFTTYKQHQLGFHKPINPIEMLIWISTPPWACCYKLSEREKETFFVNITKQTVLMGSLKSYARVKMDLRFPVSPLRKTSLRRIYRTIFTKLQKRSFSKHPPTGNSSTDTKIRRCLRPFSLTELLTKFKMEQTCKSLYGANAIRRN